MSNLQVSIQPKTSGPGQTSQLWRRFYKNKTAVVGMVIFVFMVLVALCASLIASHDPNFTNMSAVLGKPSAEHWFGTDQVGRDIFSRIVYGARVSLFVGVIAVGISLLLGTLLGLIAGFYGKRVGEVIMRFMDILLAFPSILLAIAIMTGLGRGVGNAMVAIGVVGIPVYARLVRGSVLSIKGNEFVEAATAVGAGKLRIVARHIFPNVVAPLIVQATLGMSTAILEAAALGFLGLGVQPPQAEWGDMIAQGRRFIYNAPYMIYFPGAAISLTVLGLNLFGDGLRDVLDPRLKK